MRVRRFLLAAVLCLAGFGASAGVTPVHALLLDFNGNICGGASCSNFQFIDQSYGDTAQVDVIYANIAPSPSDPGLRFWDNDYNDLVNVAWTSGGDGLSVAEIFLDPSTGYQVTLQGFDLGAWLDTTHNSQYTIYDGTSNTILQARGESFP